MKSTSLNDGRSKRSKLILPDTPVYKIENTGRRSVSEPELISTILSPGDGSKNLQLAQKIYATCDYSLNVIGKLSCFELQIMFGLNANKSAQIVAAIELGRRHQLEDARIKMQMRSSKDIYDVIYPYISDLLFEEFWVIYLNKANKIQNISRISQGGITGTVVDVKMIMKEAIMRTSSSMALIHNHPSGNLQPSDADISLTRKMKDAGKLLDILVIDHLIIGDKEYYSFADNGLI